MEHTIYYVSISYLSRDYADNNKNVIPDNEVSLIKDVLTDADVTIYRGLMLY